MIIENGWYQRGSTAVKMFGNTLVKVHSSEAVEFKSTLTDECDLDITYLENILKEVKMVHPHLKQAGGNNMETFEVVDVLERNFAGALSSDDQQFIREVASLGFKRVKIEGKGWVRIGRRIVDAVTQEMAMFFTQLQDGPAAEIISVNLLSSCGICGGAEEHIDEGDKPE